jgi:A/G-specific adenine glycosylase
LIALKGVGPYTAAAVASFSSNEAVPVVDGNVYRVLSRYFGLETDIASAKARKEFTYLALEVMDKQRPSDFNQAIMEFGALQCVPKSPNCSECIFNDSCWAFQNDKVALLPVKSQKVKITNRYFNYLVVFDSEDATLIQKRTQKGIWHNLYEFPLIESEKELNEKEIKERVTTQFPEFQSMNLLVAYENQSRLHKLSHQHLYIRFWRLEISGKLSAGISKKEAIKKPFPAVVFNFIENYF